MDKIAPFQTTFCKTFFLSEVLQQKINMMQNMANNEEMRLYFLKAFKLRISTNRKKHLLHGSLKTNRLVMTSILFDGFLENQNF